MLPVLGSARPSSSSTVVDLPAPFGPSSAPISPGQTSKLTASSVRSPPPPPIVSSTRRVDAAQVGPAEPDGVCHCLVEGVSVALVLTDQAGQVGSAVVQPRHRWFPGRALAHAARKARAGIRAARWPSVPDPGATMTSARGIGRAG